MHFILRLSVVLLILTVATAGADTITILSEGTFIDPGEWNNVNGFNVPIVPVAAWQPPFGGASWISFANTGNGGMVVPNGTITTFFQSFVLPYAQNTGGVWIWADDTSTVWLDGVQLMAWAPGPNWPACDGVIGCTPQSGWFLNLNGIGAGAHMLQFDVIQMAGDGYGLLYSGSVESVPEPASMVLFGSGLLGLAGIVRRRIFS